MSTPRLAISGLLGSSLHGRGGSPVAGCHSVVSLRLQLPAVRGLLFSALASPFCYGSAVLCLLPSPNYLVVEWVGEYQTCCLVARGLCLVLSEFIDPPSITDLVHDCALARVHLLPAHVPRVILVCLALWLLGPLVFALPCLLPLLVQGLAQPCWDVCLWLWLLSSDSASNIPVLIVWNVLSFPCPCTMAWVLLHVRLRGNCWSLWLVWSAMACCGRAPQFSLVWQCTRGWVSLGPSLTAGCI